MLIVEGDISLLTRMQFNIGDMLMIAAVAVWAIYSLLVRRRPADLSAPVMLVGSIGAALVLLAPLAAWEVGANGLPRITRELVLARAGQFVNLMPVFGTMLSVLLLGDGKSTVAQCWGVLFSS